MAALDRREHAVGAVGRFRRSARCLGFIAKLKCRERKTQCGH
jgi:hypothetical protein